MTRRKPLRGGVVVNQLRLVNDTVVNVAQFLMEPVGAARVINIHLDQLPLDHDLTARDVDAHVRLTRIETGILAMGNASGIAELECVRCLTRFDTPFESTFDAEFRPSIEVRTGEPLLLPEDSEIFVIDNNHLLDLSELLRQVIIVALPIRPVCGPECPGFQREFGAEEDTTEEWAAVLRHLLEEGTE